MPRSNFKILHEKAYNYIKASIMNHTLDASTIYSESKIALELGISRTPVRDAVHRLYQEGIVDIIPNKGFALHQMTEQDVMETYEVRYAIEGYCARKAAENHDRITPELSRDLRSSLELQYSIYNSTRDADTFSTEDQHFHFLLVSCCENNAILDFFNQYIYKIKKFANYSLQFEERMAKTLAEHQAIYDAIFAGDIHGAYDAMLVHLAAPLDLHIESVNR